jgi:hypothetical protein
MASATAGRVLAMRRVDNNIAFHAILPPGPLLCGLFAVRLELCPGPLLSELQSGTVMMLLLLPGSQGD